MISTQQRSTGRRMMLGGGGALAATAVIAGGRRAQAAEKLSVIIGTSPPDPACHYLYYARDAGFFQSSGLEVEFRGIVSATNATRSVVSGEADIGWVDSVSSLQARQAGARIKVISAFASRTDYQIVGVKGAADMRGLKGKRFGVATIGGSTYVIPRLLIRKAGGDPDATSWVTVGNSAARVQALATGAIDATITTTSFMPTVLRHDQLHLIVDTGPALPDFAYTWEIAGDAVIARRRPALQAFVKATEQAIAWAQQNRDKAIAFSQALLPDAPRDEIAAAIGSYLDRRYWRADGTVPPEVLNGTVSVLMGADQLNRAITYDEFVDPTIAKPG
jgi:NitT/TauT family transport system substrate-binding protein